MNIGIDSDTRLLVMAFLSYLLYYEFLLQRTKICCFAGTKNKKRGKVAIEISRFDFRLFSVFHLMAFADKGLLRLQWLAGLVK